MSSPVLAVSAGTTVSRAALLMAQRKVGSFVVEVHGKPAGIVTERDLVRKVMARGLDATRTRVGEVMSSPLLRAAPSMTVEKGARMMATAGVRRLPLFDGDEMVGIVSVDDIVRAAPHLASVDIGQAASVDEVFLVHRDGRLIYHRSLGRDSVDDADIFAGMLSLVRSFVADTLERRGAARASPVASLSLGAFNITLRRGKHAAAVVVLRGAPTESLVDKLGILVERIDERFGRKLEAWNGMPADLPGIEECFRVFD